MCQKFLSAAVDRIFHQSIQTPGSGSKGKGVRTEILLLCGEVEFGHAACEHCKLRYEVDLGREHSCATGYYAYQLAALSYDSYIA